jgi:predicted ArsR family transcriptional regulator
MEVPKLDLLKTLGDNTRYAIYLELARSPRPLSTSDVADSLALHPNTVRPHLERMREVGLLDVRIDVPSGVGRPQHRYSIAADAPSMGLEPPTFPLLASMLVSLAQRTGAGPDDAEAVGHQQGLIDAETAPPSASCLEALVARLDALGFDPTIGGSEDGDEAVIAFANCPFRELAEKYPRLVCSLHRGLVQGFVETMPDGEVGEFHTLEHRQPCQMTLISR